MLWIRATMDLADREVYSIQLKFNLRSEFWYFVSAFHLQACLPPVLSVLQVHVLLFCLNQITILQIITLRKVHPVYVTGVRTSPVEVKILPWYIERNVFSRLPIKTENALKMTENQAHSCFICILPLTTIGALNYHS
jgi:hypothetical protein